MRAVRTSTVSTAPPAGGIRRLSMRYGLDSVARLDGQVGLVTGGGRGIGAAVARELASAGMRIAVTGRTEAQIRSVADEIGGLALVGDVARRSDVERWVAETEGGLGPIDLLVNNAAIVGAPEPFWEHPPTEWWRIFEVNVLGAFLCCHAVLPGMVKRRRGRIVNVTSGAAYIRDLPAVGGDTSYPPSKAALTRFTERLAGELADHGVLAFAVAPGIVRSEMTASLPDTIPWTPPEAPPRLIRGLAEGKADALSGRYLHAEHDADLDALAARAGEIRQHDLNAIRLRR
jgi:NAD(P)-dependent dehydrogenase (short-subunit alcohol dehydrogenase family)